MRPDQYEAIQAISERLADVVIADADPSNWIGNNVLPKDLTKEERGDAYWCRKLACASLSVLTRVAYLTKQEHNNNGFAAEGVQRDSLLDAEIAAAEKESEKLLASLQKRQEKKAKFDKHVHGKP